MITCYNEIAERQQDPASIPIDPSRLPRFSVIIGSLAYHNKAGYSVWKDRISSERKI